MSEANKGVCIAAGGPAFGQMESKAAADWREQHLRTTCVDYAIRSGAVGDAIVTRAQALYDFITSERK